MKLARRLQLFSSFFMMSHSKIAAGRNGAHRFKSAATTALVLSAMAGGVMLSGIQAKAQCAPPADANGNMLDPLGNPSSATCDVNDPTKGLQKTKATTIDVTDLIAKNPGVNISYELTGLYYPQSQTQIDTDFNGPFTQSSTYSIYKVEGLNGTLIDGIDLSASGIGGFTVKKEVFKDAGLTDLIATLDLTGAGFKPVVPLSPIQTIYIKDTYNNPVLGQSSIDNVQNTVRTPGPLPVLGAGAAFGFSRKLRGRIKAARLG